MIKRLLEENGYRVLDGADGKSAFKLFIDNQKDVKLLLLNLNMPFMDGLSTFMEIKKINPKIKAILITGTMEINGIKENLGFNNVLKKPFNFQDLLKSIYEILREES